MITHDLSTVAAYADRIAVMYLGRIVEIGRRPTVLSDPQHPYTRALALGGAGAGSVGARRPVILVGETPDPSRIPSGCRFHPRCPVAFDRCPREDPPLFDLGGGHEAACLLVEDRAADQPGERPGGGQRLKRRHGRRAEQQQDHQPADTDGDRPRPDQPRQPAARSTRIAPPGERPRCAGQPGNGRPEGLGQGR